MSSDARDFNIETRAVINFFLLEGKELKEIHAIVIEKLGEHAPSSTTDKNWVDQFLNVAILPHVMRLVLEGPKQ